jgi:hypothetical protein
VLGIGLAGVHRDPLDPRLDLLIGVLGARARVAVRADELRERRQLAAPRVVLDELEIDFVQLDEDQRCHGQGEAGAIMQQMR